MLCRSMGRGVAVSAEVLPDHGSNDVPRAPRDRIQITVFGEDAAVVVAVRGFVDGLTTPALSEHLEVEVSRRPAAIIIDLTDVDFLSSAGLEALLRARRAGKEVATEVVVVADGPATSRPITITGIDHEIPLFATLDMARDAVTR